MLRNVKDLRGYAIRATDGVIGHVDDFYFDDEAWAIRYLVVRSVEKPNEGGLIPQILEMRSVIADRSGYHHRGISHCKGFTK